MVSKMLNLQCQRKQITQNTVSSELAKKQLTRESPVPNKKNSPVLFICDIVQEVASCK